MDDIQKAIPVHAQEYSSTKTYKMFGETLMLNTQQRIILDMPTTLADLFEYFHGCDMAAIAHLEAEENDCNNENNMAEEP